MALRMILRRSPATPAGGLAFMVARGCA
jgi:hypothetical protein